ncbi:MAG: DUF192 domain-containing protein [Paracoccaceae bacterium]
MGKRHSRTQVALAALWLIGCAGRVAADVGCSDGKVDLRWPGGAAVFSVEVADDDAERHLGLMNRDRMPEGHGMLFVYDRPRIVAFWMKNTRIPLDMIFAGADGRVRKIQENARPFDETAIPGGDDIQFVLEINGGLAGRLGITPGAELRHPAIDSDKAAWPCGIAE